MPNKKNIVTLADEERHKLESISRSYRHSTRERNRAKTLLLADTGREGGSLCDAKIAQVVGYQPLAVSKVRERAISGGALAALKHKEQERRKQRRLDGAGEAQLVAIACSQAPEGGKRWTIRLLKERLIQMEVVEEIGETSIRRTLKKTGSSPG